MKCRVFVCLLTVAVAASSIQAQDMLSLRATPVKSGAPTEGPVMLVDDFDSLTVGPLAGQASAPGNTFGSFDGTVVDVGGGDLELNQINTFVDGAFFPEIQILSFGATAVANDGFVLCVDYSVTDLLTSRFYTPIAANEGFIFTRFGDSNGDGEWDVLETNGAGGGVFLATGAAIPLAGTIEFEILDLAMEIRVNGTTVYTGGIIGINGDPGITPGETLTNMNFDSLNDVGGLNSEQNISRVAINDCGGMTGCSFALGDVNNDGVVSLLDVSAFVAAVTGGPGAFVCEADINEDGIVSLLDVQPFVNIITGG